MKQLEDPKISSTIQIGITLIGIVSGAFGGVAIADDVTPLFAMIPGAEVYAKDLAMITTVIVITYLSLIIGELVPQIHRSQQSRALCNLAESRHDSADQDFIPFCLVAQHFHPPAQQTDRSENAKNA